MAATVLRERLDRTGLGERVLIDSAGTGAWHVGQSMDPRARGALRERGYTDLDHRATKFEPGWFTERDLILALDNGHVEELRALAPADATATVALLRSFDPQAVATGELEIVDPYYDGRFEDRLGDIERACDGLVARLHVALDP